MTTTRAQIALFPNLEPDTKSDPKTVGARAPTLRLISAHKIPTASDRHNNPSKARVSLWPDAQILTAVREHCHSRNITLSNFFEIAATNLLNTDSAAEPKCGRARASTIDRLDLKEDSDDTIINLHRFWTNAYNQRLTKTHQFRPITWTSRDTAAAQPYANHDPRLIECAIILTLSQKPDETGPIRRFKYYQTEIIKLLLAESQLTESTITQMHQRYRNKLAAWLNVTLDS